MSNIKKITQYSRELQLLYVEDNEESREAIFSILELFFENIVVGVNGKDGLGKFKKSANIDIVITDIDMPIMDGLEMSKEILEINPFIPIFIFSAYNDASYFMDAIKMGVQGYLLKPLDIDQFTASLGKTIETIKLKQENDAYKTSLEQKVQIQLEELREKDKLLLQSEKMASMGDMLDIIAHQWKQPLNAISMQTELLSLSMDDATHIDKNDIVECSDSVREQVQHLIYTLDEFRGFFRPTLSVETINLQELFDGLEVLMQDVFICHQIELITDFKNIKFDANKNELKHIFINLINNAKDAFIQNNIKNRKIIAQAIESTTDIIITLEDNAGGISNEIIKHIFEQNFSTKKDIGGTGIGLYICKIIAQKYGADIRVESFDNSTKFIITLAKNKKYMQKEQHF